MSLFGLEFKSREEREREERDYLYRIFYLDENGNRSSSQAGYYRVEIEQKKAVEKELASKLPWVEIRGLMLYYVLMRDAMTGRDEMDFEDAVVKVSKRQRMIKVTPEILKVVREVLDENG